jgi:hypothetical protein
MARVRGIVADSQYLVKGGVVERAKFNKQPELRGYVSVMAVLGHTPLTNRLY